MKLVILAGGRGTRLSEETSVRPKPMVELGGRPILWHIMKYYSCFGVNEFVICLGYRGYLIKEYFANYALHSSDVTLDLRTGAMDVHRNLAEDWRVTLVNTGDDTMTGGRLKRVADWLGDEPFCMTYGDGLAAIDLAAEIAFHRAHGRKATVAAVPPASRFGQLTLDGDRVTAFVEKPAQGQSRINGGFFVLDPSVLDYIDGDATSWEREPLERFAAEGELRAFAHDGFWHAMDTARDRQQLQSLWETGAAPWKIWR